MAILKRLYRWNCMAAGICLFGVALLITADVLKRWLAGKPFFGVFEFSEVAFLVFTFLALGLVEHQGRQMKIDLLSSRVRGRAGHLLGVLTALLGLGFWGWIMWTGAEEWLTAHQIQDIRPGLIEIPTIIHLGFLVYGSLFMCLSLLTSIVINFGQLFVPAVDEASASLEEKIRKDKASWM